MPNKPFPFIFSKIETSKPFNQKYAPKFIHNLIIINPQQISLRTRYIKRTADVYCYTNWFSHDSQQKPIIRKISKRFNKFCKNIKDFDPAFSSLGLCQRTSVTPQPFLLEIGRFTSLLLQFETPFRNFNVLRNKSPISKEQTSKIFRNIEFCKPLRKLYLIFDEDNLNVSTPLILKLQKHPLILSSLQILKLHYKCLTVVGLTKLSNVLTSKQDILQFTTHFSIEGCVIKQSHLKLQDFTNLISLSIDIKHSCEGIFSSLLSLKTLKNLKAFRLDTPIANHGQMEHFLENFQLPNSIKKIRLTLIAHCWDEFVKVYQIPSKDKKPLQKSSFSNLIQSFICSKKPKPKSKYSIAHPNADNFFEEWNTYQQFYEKWNDFDQLTDLTLNIESSTACADINFLFMIPILKRCHNLKRLTLSAYCIIHYVSQQELRESRYLKWEKILRVLEPFQNTLEYLNLRTCQLIFNEFLLPKLKFKNLKTLFINIEKIKPADIMKPLMSLTPSENSPNKKMRGESHFSFSVNLENEQDFQTLFSSLEYIPKYVTLALHIGIWKVTAKIFSSGLLDFVSSAKIEGNLQIDLHEKGDAFDSPKWKEFLAKVGNISCSGCLSIYHDRFGLIFERKKATSVSFAQL